ncbi:predicted protein [Naegleria gruberi]|uniref:Predicted protein n=1 Tax=Naegleria gruberi TaxID=5762 RepID=D2VKX4_NAEGR|nr:uncharacterized protein NAEGRDRAFT_82679 [Naegleria gruberi]EFC42443.1 predicted protein [Naegleria gruberi]|eukprot:XP_002675187.1 predicted protein [Naegleria gruberi strain NEG-M]
MMRISSIAFLLLSTCLIVAVGCAFGQQPKSTPVWPGTFRQTFTETTQLFKFMSPFVTNGTYYYDVTNQRQRIDRLDGSHDRYCGSVHFDKSTPCVHLVVKEKRYLVFPELKSCCMCCTAENGCGVLKTNWLFNSTYIGQTTYNGYPVHQWDKKGLQNNYYYEMIANNVPVAIDQQPNDLMVFDPKSYSTTPLPDSLFAVPSYCTDDSGKDHSCPFFSICTIA